MSPVTDPSVTLVDGFVPVIDLATAQGPSPRRLAAARTLGRVCATSGFFAVVNHGIPAATTAALQQATRAFFALPAEQKEALRVDPTDPLMRGYGRETEPAIQREQGPGGSQLETFVVNRLGEPLPAPLRPANGDEALCAANRWPALPGFREAFLAYFAESERLAAQIMGLFALALDLPEDWFEDKFAAHATSMAANRYPGQPGRPAKDQLRKGEHTDWGTLTILLKDEADAGLQVLDRDRRWVNVPSVPGSLVVNIGDLMAQWTNGRWASTVHRVVHTGDDTGHDDRYSVAFFHQPSYDALIECIPSCVTEQHPARHAPATFGDYLTAKMRRAYLHRRIAENLRAPR
nr:2-oxoglutarate and iron-dependent oxygenase domain-containing protein [Dactylosporangium thailandense]